ncbi:hypothetical protein BUALT_Bualt06G0068200 [Buddleja alternifolia]|uniref:BED-type domain-containing protein n=1 Tax=Buddleja alternifolia TaxID=168488 RepID=A0AAV6XEM4_9LAMI|nr:hypothetical protein BUALT_Bualt06G0068200 [Buddleja alternifolia]
MVRKKDPVWEYVEALDGRFICKFCERNFAGGVPRIKSHLSGITGRDIDICTKVPENIQAKAFLAVAGSSKKAKNKETTSIPKNMGMLLIYQEDFNNPLAIEYGKSYKIPSYSTIRTKLIPDSRKEVDEYVAVDKKSWALTGCTLMSDIWSDMKHRSVINIVAYSPGGAVMMNSFEVSKEKKTGMYLRDILVSVIDDIGAENIVQFITDNASNFESAGDMLMGRYPHLYKTRCATHGIQLLLKDIYVEIEWLQKVIDDAKLIIMFMYKHTILLSLMREHTNNRELKHPCTTRFASNFKMVESVINVEDELRMFVASSTWRGLDYTKQTMGKQVTKIIQDSEFWKQGNEARDIEPIDLDNLNELPDYFDHDQDEDDNVSDPTEPEDLSWLDAIEDGV